MNALAPINQEHVPSVSADSLYSLLGEYLLWLDVSDKTRVSYTAGLKKWVIWRDSKGLYGYPKEPAECGRGEINGRFEFMGFRDWLADTLRPNSVNLYISAVRGFAQWASHEKGLYDFSYKVRNLKIEPGYKRDALDAETARKVTEFAKGFGNSERERRRNYAVYLCAIVSGLRVFEIAGLSVSDFSLAPNGRAVLAVKGKKRDDYTRVFIPDALKLAILEYLETRPELPADSPLFLGYSPSSIRTAGRLTPTTISRILKGILRGAGYDSERLTAHSLRHTAVTIAYLSQKAAGNVDTLQIQQFARHSDFSTTARNYIHATDESLNDCADNVAKAVV